MGWLLPGLKWQRPCRRQLSQQQKTKDERQRQLGDSRTSGLKLGMNRNGPMRSGPSDFLTSRLCGGCECPVGLEEGCTEISKRTLQSSWKLWHLSAPVNNTWL